jgi:hypothetical protein
MSFTAAMPAAAFGGLPGLRFRAALAVSAISAPVMICTIGSAQSNRTFQVIRNAARPESWGWHNQSLPVTGSAFTENLIYANILFLCFYYFFCE